MLLFVNDVVKLSSNEKKDRCKLSSCDKFKLQWDPLPRDYRYSALQAELSSQLGAGLFVDT